MKTRFHTRLICGLLALLVLLSSTGYGMVEHWCQMRGHSKSLLLAAKGCIKPCGATEEDAPHTNGPLLKKAPCCKTTLSYAHLDVSRFLADQPAQPALQLVEFIPNAPFQALLLSLLSPVTVNTKAVPLATDPLFRPGRFRLLAGCSWLL